MDNLQQLLANACKEVYDTSLQPEVSRTDEQFGDYATNVALKLAGSLANTSPRQIAEKLAVRLRENELFSRVEVAGPGFINLSLSDSGLLELVKTNPKQSLKGKVVVAEYSDPNPFKILHAGHLYTSMVGDGIANLLQAAGAVVHRVNFGGDVGLHVAKMMWAIIQKLGGEHPEKITAMDADALNEFITSAYIAGTSAYEEDGAAKTAIIALNKQIYAIHAENDHDSALARMYWTMRSLYYDVYFKVFYESIGTQFERYYPESQTAPTGLKVVREQLARGVYQESNGAVIFDGEKYGLHTRVFINSEGLPTYEAKDVGLLIEKYQDYHFDQSIIITGNDIVEYMKVVLKSVEQFRPELSAATTHITHGIVKLEGGSKMSSRKGNILRAQDVLDTAAAANKAQTGNDAHETVLAAIKYSFLKQRIGADIIYNPKESVSIIGNTGPYLQYAHARACSILAKSTLEYSVPSDFDAEERSLLRKTGEFAEVVDKAVAELMPHHVCTYLYELAQTFNHFYEANRVLDDPRQATRLWLVQVYATTLKEGLGLLGITAPEKM